MFKPIGIVAGNLDHSRRPSGSGRFGIYSGRSRPTSREDNQMIA